MFKKEIRIIGWDDSSFEKGLKPQKVHLVGAIIRGGDYLDGVLSTEVNYDELDATDKISEAINKSRHKGQLRVIMTDGISFAGFNLVDIQELSKKTGLPVIVIQRKKPDIKEFLNAQKRFQDFEMRRKIVEKSGKFHRFGKVWFQFSGLSEKECQEILSLSSKHSIVPEPIRIAHIIATGLSGESRGRA
jgi:endonuclease V-like protein UPF0215 family